MKNIFNRRDNPDVLSHRAALSVQYKQSSKVEDAQHRGRQKIQQRQILNRRAWFRFVLNLSTQLHAFSCTPTKRNRSVPSQSYRHCASAASEVSQLRARVSLTRLRQQHGKTAEAHHMLPKIYNW